MFIYLYGRTENYCPHTQRVSHEVWDTEAERIGSRVACAHRVRAGVPQCGGVRGIEAFSHLWLIWDFSEAHQEQWSPTVRPPRLGGNRRMGVFATRSPFRPNPIGLSCVELIEADFNPKNPTLLVGGADLMDGTPIYDIKPYLLTTDCHPEASKGFTQEHEDYQLLVDIPEPIIKRLKPEKVEKLRAVLAQDPRPAYHHDENRIYGFLFDGYEVSFSVSERIAVVKGIKRAFKGKRY